MSVRRSTKVALPAALAALVLAAAPALTVAPAQAASAVAKPWVSVSGPSAFSPNGDGRKDTAKFTIKVKKRANVTVRVVRNGKVVRGPVKLGKRKAGATFSWTWNGKDSKGRRVADANRGYQVKVVARALKKQKRRSLQKVAARHAVTVDTDAGLPAEARLVSDSDTVYPQTVVVRDRIMFRLDDAPEVAEGTVVIRNGGGGIVHEIASKHWQTAYGFFTLAWDGRGVDGHELNLGSASRPLYEGNITAALRVKDEVGNVAETPRIKLVISGLPLRLRTAEVTLGAQETTWKASPHDCGPLSGNGCGENFPCGTVVPSTRADMPKGLSYRTKECTQEPWSGQRSGDAIARHWVKLPGDAVRGGAALSVTMRGRPTVDGETDTARLHVPGFDSEVVTSEATTGEATTTASRGHDIGQDDLYEQYGGFTEPLWTVETVGDDSYDVAQFTVTYAYLAPWSYASGWE